MLTAYYYNYVHKNNTDTVDISTEAENLCAFNVYQLANKSLDSFIFDHEASNDRAEKCSISSLYQCKSRRRLVNSQNAVADKQCTYVNM